MRTKQPTFNFGNNNNINTINKNHGRMFNSKPQYPFNPRGYSPYPRFSRPTNSNFRPFILRDNKSKVRPNNDGFQKYHSREFGSRPGYQRYPRNNRFTSFSSGTNQSSTNYSNRNNNTNNYYNNTNKTNKNNFARKGNSFYNKKYDARKNQEHAPIHQIDNIQGYSQD